MLITFVQQKYILVGKVVKLKLRRDRVFYSDVYKMTACRMLYNSPGLNITVAELPVVDMPTFIINEIKAVMNRALQQGNMDLYNKFYAGF